jgi:tryptophanyl-tRNA synthetase
MLRDKSTRIKGGLLLSQDTLHCPIFKVSNQQIIKPKPLLSSQSMDTVVSGIRSTGNLHLGNYFGAVKNFIRMQEINNCFFFIADYHSLTTHPDASLLKKNVRQVLAEYLACGLDPEKSTIYVQSDIPETAELYLLLNMHAYLGELERATTFK